MCWIDINKNNIFPNLCNTMIGDKDVSTGFENAKDRSAGTTIPVTLPLQVSKTISTILPSFRPSGILTTSLALRSQKDNSIIHQNKLFIICICKLLYNLTIIDKTRILHIKYH